MKDRVRNIILVIALVMTIASTALLLQCVSQGGIGGQGWMIREYLRVSDLRLGDKGATLVIENTADKQVFIQRIDIVYEVSYDELNKTTIAANATFDAGEEREFFFWKFSFRRVIGYNPSFTLRYINGTESYTEEYRVKTKLIDVVMVIPKYMDLRDLYFEVTSDYEGQRKGDSIGDLITTHVIALEYKKSLCYGTYVSFCVSNITITDDYLVIYAKLRGYVGAEYVIKIESRDPVVGSNLVRVFANESLPLEFRSLFRAMVINEARKVRILEGSNQSVVITAPYAHSKGNIKHLERLLNQYYIFSLRGAFNELHNELFTIFGREYEYVDLPTGEKIFEMYVEEGVLDIETENGCNVGKGFFIRRWDFAGERQVIQTPYSSIQIRFEGNCANTEAKLRVKLPLPTGLSEVDVVTHITEGFLDNINIFNESGGFVATVGASGIYKDPRGDSIRYAIRTEVDSVFGVYTFEFNYVLKSDDAMIALSSILVEPKKKGVRETRSSTWEETSLTQTGIVDERGGAGFTEDTQQIFRMSPVDNETLHHSKEAVARDQKPLPLHYRTYGHLLQTHTYHPKTFYPLSLFLRYGFKL